MGLTSLPFDSLARIGKKRPVTAEDILASSAAEMPSSSPTLRLAGPQPEPSYPAPSMSASPEPRIAQPPYVRGETEPGPYAPPSAGAEELVRRIMAHAPQVDLSEVRSQKSEVSEPEPRIAAAAAPTSDLRPPTSAAEDLYKQYGGTGDEERRLTELQGQNRANNNRGPQREKGAGNWFKDTGRAGLRGFREGGFGGLIGGLIRGAVDPQFANETQYYERDLPLATKAAEQERISKTAGMNRIQDVGQMTGELPGGEPTENARHRIAAEQDRRDQRERLTKNDAFNERIRQDQLDRNVKNDLFNERIRQDTLDERGESRREQTARNHVLMAQSSGRPVDPAAVKGTTYETYAGKVPPRVSAGEDGLTPYQKIQIEQRDRDDEDRRRKEVLGKGGLVEEYEELKREANEANAAATKLHNERSGNKGLVGGTVNAKGEITGQTIMTDADEAAAWEKRDTIVKQLEAMRQKLASEHGDILEVGKDYVKPRARAAAAAAGGKKRPESPSAAIALYKEYVAAHPEQRERARAKFMKQNPGVDPEAP